MLVKRDRATVAKYLAEWLDGSFTPPSAILA
jgi:hypothetical protein